ncbi:ser/Thr protein phosphatase family [Sodiomyces alkalinus F11]|uniref:Ser/Thr protein phosphatase family n=1 Tax=Sodiomyces alkalinus (strain CBS 110278 / VKM F-3762 / F11) TaxID=1314773 RepID=A0A3N2Q302_SODAK|nr:ser/Thr protein phosphatase family [Sodiomyces alkalinus F11]ROT40995.1 ser/Thr protein phosphatase family [Sodiomyces alkalinus F11]
MLITTLLFSALWRLARAAQPGAAQPVAAPMRELSWGQLNFLHTTDSHGWLGGHLQEPQYSADWGDYVSFAEHMRRKADEKGVDLIVIDTGDRVEGNGLYDASSPKGLFTYDIFREQTIDVLCSGNHELYKADAADREHNTTVPNFKENYIASNLDYLDDNTGVLVPMAQRYRKFRTKNLGLEIVTFGFLFNFDKNANNTVVQRVEDTIREEWFQKVLREEKPDVFVVTGHVGLRMPESRAIFEAIRKQHWFAPILFFGGHVHVRDARRFDDKSYGIASGRYMETIGWASVDGIGKRTEDDEVAGVRGSVSFSRRYIDNNLYGLYHHTGLNESTFPTPRGQGVSEMIDRARVSLGLDYKLGCAPRDLWVSRAKYPGEGSMYTWIENEVLPDVVVRQDRKDKPRLIITNTGALRFDIFKGPFTKDNTYLVFPFTSKFRYIPDVPYQVAKKVLPLINRAGPVFQASLDTQFLNVPEAMASKKYFVATDDEDGSDEGSFFELKGPESAQRPLGGVEAETAMSVPTPQLLAGYTTEDDMGTDGDDTERSPIKMYAVPNCVQAEVGFPEEDGRPDKVDLVFIDFTQPWIIPALKFSGGDYSDADVEQWDHETLTYKVGEWIRKNWDGDC